MINIYKKDQETEEKLISALYFYDVYLADNAG